MSDSDKVPVVLFDGFCVLCSRFASGLIKRLGNQIELVPMQTEHGGSVLEQHNLSVESDEVIVVTPENNCLKGYKGILFLMKMAGGNWGFIEKILRVFPGAFLSCGYSIVARNRYKWFGKRDSCFLINNN